MHCSLFLRDNFVYIPTAYKTDAGFYIERDPVATIPVDQSDVLSQKITEFLLQDPPRIPTPDRSASEERPDILKYVKYKTWAAFSRHAETWSVGRARTGEFSIAVGRKVKPGAWLYDRKRLITFPAGSALSEVVARTVSEIQAKAREISGV